MKSMLFVALIIFSNSFGLADDDVAATINAEVQLTRQKLKSISAQLGDLKSTPYKDIEYESLSKEFKVRVDKALAEYDSALQSVFLPKVQYWLNRFASSIQGINDPDYIKKTQNLTETQLKLLQPAYQAIVEGLYTAVLGDVPLTVDYVVATGDESQCGPPKARENQYADYHHFLKVERRTAVIVFTSGKRVAVPEATEACLGGRELGSPATTVFYKKGLFNDDINSNLVTLKISGLYPYGCGSEICKKLRRADYEHFIILVSDLVDQPMDFSVGGIKFTTNNSGLNVIRPPVLE